MGRLVESEMSKIKNQNNFLLGLEITRPFFSEFKFFQKSMQKLNVG